MADAVPISGATRSSEDRIGTSSGSEATSRNTRCELGRSGTHGLSGGSHQTPLKRRKVLKVTRACDTCKKRKSRCSGTLPCNSCCNRGRPGDCHYNAEYRRGQLVTPAQRIVAVAGPSDKASESSSRQPAPRDRKSGMEPDSITDIRPGVASQSRDAGLSTADDEILVGQETIAPSRASPELGMAEIQGQYFDTTSGLAFLHRAFGRLSKNGENQPTRPLPELAADVDNEDSPTLTVGDKPLGTVRQDNVELPSLQRATELVHSYFDVCIATYRFLHLQSVEDWLQTMMHNDQSSMPVFHGLGRAKAAIVLIILAIATAHEDKAIGRFQQDEVASMNHSDSFYSMANALIQQETARPTLASAQARIIQVLYLLTTSRMNQAWYTFGTAFQLISALGLHRKAGKKYMNTSKNDYILMQCRRRTFWTAYILDKYLGVIFGRPRHYNDDEIDQDLPDSVNDEDMTPTGPRKGYNRCRKDCHIDALIYHVKIATIISEAARTVYSIKHIPQQDRIAAANRLNDELKQWRSSLPPHLGTIAPSSLIPRFRRQATTLKIAYSHAIMHVNRLFLLGRISSGSEAQIRKAILSAHTVLETIDEMVVEGGTIFHAFWWSHYVTFCALAIVYAWEIQSRRTQFNIFPDQEVDQHELMQLAERCQRHLAKATASNSPSRKYALILEKLHKEVLRNSKEGEETRSAEIQVVDGQALEANQGSQVLPEVIEAQVTNQFYSMQSDTTSPQQLGLGLPFDSMNWSIQDWHSEDWLNLDSMALGTLSDSYDTPFIWDGNET